MATITEPVSRQGYRQLRQFAARWPAAVWAIEGTSGLGAPLASRLSGDGIGAVDVPAKLAARVPMLSTGHGRKNDDADAVSVGIAALTAPGLRRSAVLPGGAPRQLSGDTAAAPLRTLRPHASGARTLRRLAADLIAEIRHLDRRIAARSDDIAAAVAEAGCTLAELRGNCALLAGKILAWGR